MVDRAVGWVEALGKTITVSDLPEFASSRLGVAIVHGCASGSPTLRSTHSPTTESTTHIDDEMITEALDKAGLVDYRAQSAAG
jgi:hypothetical protein